MKAVFDVPRTSMEVFKLLPEGTRCEVIDNEIYMLPPPGLSHQRLVRVLLQKISKGLNSKGELLIGPLDVFLNEERPIILQPDLIIVLHSNSMIVKEDAIHGVPDVIIEVLSSDAERDRVIKKDLYGEAGVKEYFVVDPDTLVCTCWSSAPGGYQEKQVKGLFSSSVLGIEFEFNQ